MHSFEVFREYEMSAWTLKEIPWHDIDRQRLHPEYVRLAKSAVMGECNSIAALHGFLNELPDDYDFGAFSSIWGYQELQHHYAFRTWLNEIGEQPDEAAVEVTRVVYPPGTTPAATLATNVISELTVCHVYSGLAREIEEPVLRQILTYASRDEARHAREFRHFLERRLQQHPREMASVLETLYVYTADPAKPIKHPVSVFKGALPELQGLETIDTGFEIFRSMSSEGSVERLRSKIFNVFESITGHEVSRPAALRRALAGYLE